MGLSIGMDNGNDRDGQIEMALVAEHVAQVGVRLGKVRLELQRPAKQVKGLMTIGSPIEVEGRDLDGLKQEVREFLVTHVEG